MCPDCISSKVLCASHSNDRDAEVLPTGNMLEAEA